MTLTPSQLESFAEKISFTGFDLEHRVATVFRRHEWNVIQNRYYIDDVQGTARELDLVAYKAISIEEVTYYTTILVSCKKSKDRVWALLSSGDKDDPNIDWLPVHNWLNRPSLQHTLETEDWKQRYFKLCREGGVFKTLIYPQTHIFAFQEMDKKSGIPKDDRPIFESVSTLMKAQGYEFLSLPQRKKGHALYQFNLMSVVDADLIRILFTNNARKASPVLEDKFIARYIVNREETHARIHFVTADALESVLTDYDQLHTINYNFFSQLDSDFFKNVMSDRSRINALLPSFIQIVGRYLRVFSKNNDAEIEIRWDSTTEEAIISVDVSEETISQFNSGNHLAWTLAKRALEEVYHYYGKFRFEEYFPF